MGCGGSRSQVAVEAEEVAEGRRSSKFGSKKKSKDGMPPSIIHTLSDDQLEEFKECFKNFDKDGGGVIDKDELRDLFISLGQNPSEEEMNAMVACADADGSGEIDFMEFVCLMAHKMSETSPEATLRNAFAVFDKNGDGCISAHEMMRIMINLGESISLEGVKEVIRDLDENGDGMIDYDEFTKVLASQKPRPCELSPDPSQW